MVQLAAVPLIIRCKPRLEKRFSNGLSFLAAYTYGKAIDERSQASFGIGSGDGFRDSTRHPEWETRVGRL